MSGPQKVGTIGVANTILGFALLLITGTLSGLPDFPLSKREMGVRAGYYTEGGKYLGGIPNYNDSLQLNECVELSSISSARVNNPALNSTTNTSYSSDTAIDVTPEVGTNATVCVTWTAHSTNPHAPETSSCACQSVAEGVYCDAWSCSSAGEVFKRCTCDTRDSDDSWAFCASWGCEERDNDNAEAFGEYTCVSTSPSTEFCEAWTGVVEGAREVGVATCECVEEWDGAGVCSNWECKERDLDKCNHSYGGMCNLGFALGVGGSFGSMVALMFAWSINNMDKEDLGFGMLMWAGGLLMMAMSAFAVITWGGQDAIMYAGIWWGTIITFGVLRRCFAQNPAPIISCFTAGCDRICQYRDELDPPIPNDAMPDPPIPNDVAAA